MTFDTALKQWRVAPRNNILANNSKDAVRNIILKKYKDIDLEQFTEMFCRRIFEECPFDQTWKTQAASILIYVLEWGADHGLCQRPKFDRSIALPQPKRETSEPVSETPKKENEVVNCVSVEKLPSNTPKKVVQIDPDTLKAVRTFDSIALAQKEASCKNILRAIENRSMSGGYYWCYPGDEEGFKPKEKKCAGRPSKKKVIEKLNIPKKKAVKQETEKVMNENNSISVMRLEDYSDEQLFEELKRRGYSGNLQIVKNIVL